MELRAGTRLRSAVCATEIVAIRVPDGDVDVRCGGVPAVPFDSSSAVGTPLAGFDAGSQLGKRYTDAAVTIELLCTKAGAGSLSLGDEVLAIKDAKALPASD